MNKVRLSNGEELSLETLLSFTWKTKKGVVTTLGEMTETHLINCAAWLRRKALEEGSAHWSVGSMLQGEHAIDEWEYAQRNVERRCSYMNLLAEAMDIARFNRFGAV